MVPAQGVRFCACHSKVGATGHNAAVYLTINRVQTLVKAIVRLIIANAFTHTFHTAENSSFLFVGSSNTERDPMPFMTQRSPIPVASSTIARFDRWGTPTIASLISVYQSIFWSLSRRWHADSGRLILQPRFVFPWPGLRLAMPDLTRLNELL